jgi:hypothetical protein
MKANELSEEIGQLKTTVINGIIRATDAATLQNYYFYNNKFDKLPYLQRK